MANIPFKSITFPGLPNKYTVPEISSDLMTAGKAADAKKVGDALSALEDAVTEETDKLKADLVNITGIEPIEFSSGYIAIGGNATVDLTTSVEYQNYRHAIVSCAENDKFVVSGVAGGTPRLWAFIDSSNNVLIRADAGQNVNNVIITAPTNANRLIINDNGNRASYKGISESVSNDTDYGYFAFGDSAIKGAVWAKTSGGSITYADEKDKIPTRIASILGKLNNYTNLSVGGIGYLHQIDSKTVVDLIEEADLSTAGLITVSCGGNDWNATLGTWGSTAGDGTICGAIKSIISYVKTNLPKAELVFMQPLPFTNSATPFASAGGYWSLDDFDREVSKICEDANVGYTNWYGCSYINNWASNTGGYNGSTGPNYAHPTDGNDYAILGDFIAGKIKAMCSYHDAIKSAFSLGAHYVRTFGSNTNLNTITDAGNYKCPSAAVAATLTNSPVTNAAFRLEVLKTNIDGRLFQFLYANVTPAKVYYRYGTNSGGSFVFQDWQMVITNYNLDKTNQRVSKLETLSGCIIPDESNFEIGGINFSTEGWEYGTNPNRVRTKEGFSYSLKKGDVIGLTDYTGMSFQAGVLRGDGTYGYTSRTQRSDYVCTSDGDWAIVLKAYPNDVAQTNVNNFLSRLFIRPNDQNRLGFKYQLWDKPILTIIDDDTLSVAHVTKFYNACKYKGIVGTFATESKPLETQAGLADLLKSYEDEGFHIAYHCYNQTDIYRSASQYRDSEAVEADFASGLRKLHSYGFLNPDLWVAPYGSHDAELQALAKKRGMKCLVSIAQSTYESYPVANGRWFIPRVGLNQRDSDGRVPLAQLKTIMADCAENNGWLLVGTHFDTWDTETGFDRFYEIVDYANELGFDIKTLGEAYEIWKPAYDRKALFD